MMMQKLILGTVILMLGMGAACAAQDRDPLPGAVGMADALLQRHEYLRDSIDREKLDAVHRDLREAEHVLRKPAPDADDKKEALEKRGDASKRLLELLQAASCAQTVRMSSQTAMTAPLAPVHLPGDSAAFLFRVENGEGPVQCKVSLLDLSVAAGTHLGISDIPKGTTWVLAGLDRIPQGRISHRFEFTADGDGELTVPFETVTLAHGLLGVRVLSDDTGKPAPAMIRLEWKTDGSEAKPANALDFAVLFDNQGSATGLRRANIPGKLGARYWCIPGPFEMALPPGEYSVTVLRGIEHAPVQDTVTVESNKTVTRSYRPERWVNMAKTGWYSGDDHVHTQILSDRDAGLVMNWIQAEDVHLANIVKMGDIYRTWFEQRGFGKSFRVEDGGYILSPGQECPRTHEELGHTLAMNITGMVRNTDQYYLYDKVFDEVHRQGGLSGYAHTNSDSFYVHRDMSINIPKGKVDFAEVLQFAKLGTDLYYDFLNLGCKVTASAGSDVPWGGSVGEVRVYAHTGKKKFTADRWFDAVRRGNTFVTNGLMLDFTVQGAGPGEEVDVTDNRPLRVKARAWGDARRDVPAKLEIIVHGAPVKTVVPEGADQASLEADFTIPSGNGFWIAAKAEGRDGTRAHTTPVYVVRKGLRFWKYDGLAELITRQEASLAEVEHIVAEAQAGRDPNGEANPDLPVTEMAKQGPALLERVAAAKQLYAELRATAEHEATLRK